MSTIPLLTLLIIFVSYQKRNNWKFGSISYLLTLYILMGITSLILTYTKILPSSFKFSFEAMIYLSICFSIIFYGFFNFREVNIHKIKITNLKLFKLLEIALIIGGFIAIFFFLPHAIKGISGDVAFNRKNNLEIQTVLGGYKLINTIISIFANLFIVSITLSFINFARGSKFKLRAYLLLFSSISYVIYILAYVGRDGSVYWGMSFMFIFLLFKDFLKINVTKKLIKLILFIFILLAIPFSIISIARFSNSDFGVIWELVNYMGQMIKNFNDSYLVNAPLTNGSNSFPLFYEWFYNMGLLSQNMEVKIETQQFYFLHNDVFPWVFTTFIGSFLIDFGNVGTLILLIILSGISKNIINKINKTNTLNFSNLIIFILLYQNVLWGIFYFRLYSLNLYILIMIFISIIFKVFIVKKNPIFILKVNC